MIARLVVAAALMSLLVGIASAWHPVTGLFQKRQLCKKIDVDGGFPAATNVTGTDGYSTVNCFNASTEPVYFGNASMTTADGYPICSAATCAGSSISMQVRSNELYCTTATDTADGGTPVKCIMGH